MTAKQIRLLKEDLVGWSFCLIPIVLFLTFIAVPLLMAVYLSFTNYDMGITMDWVGFRQYQMLFTFPAFRDDMLRSFVNALYFTALNVPLGVFIPFVLAAMLHTGIRGAKVFRVLLYLPGLTGAVAMSMIWQWFFHPIYSPVNGLLGKLGLPALQFISSPTQAMPSLVLMMVWSGIGGGTILFTAGMQMIPGDYYEAARLDGAGGVRQFWSITVPMLAPTTYFQTTMSIIGSLQLFDPVYLLTNGGPVKSTMTPGYLIYNMSFVQSAAGTACAFAMVFFLLVMAVTFLFQRIGKESYL